MYIINKPYLSFYREKINLKSLEWICNVLYTCRYIDGNIHQKNKTQFSWEPLIFNS